MAMPPCPYATPNDDDLTGVITHLRPSNTRKGTQPRDPNEPETRWLLEAGLRTLTALLLDTPAPEGSVAYLSANGLFSTMSLDSVMQTFRRMCTEQGIDPGGANKARILRRWDYTANYQLDLIAYLFRTSVNAHRVAQVHSAVAAALPSLTFGDLVTSLLTSESATPADAQLVRVQLVIRLMFADDPAVRALASEQFTSDVDLWTPIYEHALHAYGLQGTLQHATVRLHLYIRRSWDFRPEEVPTSDHTLRGGSGGADRSQNRCCEEVLCPLCPRARTRRPPMTTSRTSSLT